MRAGGRRGAWGARGRHVARGTGRFRPRGAGVAGYEFLALGNPKDSAPTLLAVSATLLAFAVFSTVEIALLLLFMAIMVGGVMTVLRQHLGMQHVPDPAELVSRLSSKDKVERTLQMAANALSEHISLVQDVLTWRKPVESVRGAALAWSLYRFSFLLSPSFALLALLAAVSFCAVHKHVLKGGRDIEDKLRAELAPQLERAALIVQQTLQKVQDLSDEHGGVFLGGAVAATAILLYLARFWISITSAVTLGAFLVLAHWFITLALPHSSSSSSSGAASPAVAAQSSAPGRRSKFD